MTATQKHDIISMCTTVLSADQQPKEDKMLDQQKITILYCRLSNEDAQDGESNSTAATRRTRITGFWMKKRPRSSSSSSTFALTAKARSRLRGFWKKSRF